MKRRGVKDTDPFDWEKTPTDNSLATNTTTTHAVITKPQNQDRYRIISNEFPMSKIYVCTYLSRMAYADRGGVTENMLDDNVLGPVDNQENVEAPLETTDQDARRRRRRDTVLHQQKQNNHQVRRQCAFINVLTGGNI